jgi:uncharacterized protein YycO
MLDLKTLKTCDILLYRGTGFVSRLIQWRTKSVYSHVAVVVGTDMNLAIESNTGSQAGVRALDLRKLDVKAVDAFRVQPGHAFKPEKVISYLVECLGCNYDLPGVVWLGVLKTLNMKEKANRFQINRDYFCSELVYAAFHAAGLDIVPQIGAAEVTSPGDIARSPILSKIG